MLALDIIADKNYIWPTPTRKQNSTRMPIGVELIDVVKAYGSTVVVPELSLKIEEGEFVVIVGPSGCGKSTTHRMICGLEPVTAGRVFIKERDVTYLQPKARDIAMVFKSYALYPHMNVAGNMSFALRLAGVSKAEIKSRVQAAAGRAAPATACTNS